MNKVKAVVSLSKNTIISASLNNGGKVNRNYLRAMASATESYNKYKNASLKKMTKDLSSDE